MSFYLIEYQAVDPAYQKYNGRIALVLPWQPEHNKPFDSRYVVITPLLAKDYPCYVRDPALRSTWVEGNSIRFTHYDLNPPYLTFETEGMPTFTERVEIKPPVSRWNKYGERKTYEWSWGKWLHTGWERKP